MGEGWLPPCLLPISTYPLEPVYYLLSDKLDSELSYEAELPGSVRNGSKLLSPGQTQMPDYLPSPLSFKPGTRGH